MPSPVSSSLSKNQKPNEKVLPTKQQSMWIFLDRTWTVGKAIDEIAKLGQIANDNNQKPDDQVWLFLTILSAFSQLLKTVAEDSAIFPNHQEGIAN